MQADTRDAAINPEIVLWENKWGTEVIPQDTQVLGVSSPMYQTIKLSTRVFNAGNLAC